MAHYPRIPVAHLEGLVAVGLAKRYWWEKCDTPGMTRFFVETKDGKIYETKCVDDRGARKVITYLSFISRHNKDLVLDIVVDKEEVFVPEEDEQQQ
ncbi:hypothetical protein [Pyrofollis japonicus]|uniref:hypothetical protein n=1 Tax=Pyrofollis japonicus TaxID=3060460 RepID=UPI00295A775F|nr:hypothetical protein [Pyrofollis japonicus]